MFRGDDDNAVCNHRRTAVLTAAPICSQLRGVVRKLSTLRGRSTFDACIHPLNCSAAARGA